MALIADILATEAGNVRHIHLFREGLFFRAYQHSAFQFINNVRSFKVVKKHYKAVGGDVVILGFPTTMFESLFPDPSRVEIVEEGMHIVVECEPIDERAYAVWCDTVHYAPEKPKKNPTRQIETFDFVPTGEVAETVASGGIAAAPAPIFAAAEVAAPALPASHAEVLRELQNFSIESATPLDCMLLLSKLKSKLRE